MRRGWSTADWLDEHGEDAARAELIRAQCELERLPAEDRRPALEQQIAGLLKAHAKRWLGPLRKAKIGKDWQFRRGFVQKGTLSARTFAGVAEDLFRLAPTVCSLRFPDASNELSSLIASPYLARLTEVDLGRTCSCGSCPIDRELRELFACPHVANLTTLVLATNRIDPEGARHLAASLHLARLTTLDLAGNALGPKGARALAASPHLTRLTVLDLSGNHLGTAGARALGKAPWLDSLALLDLRSNHIGARAALAWRERFGERIKL